MLTLESHYTLAPGVKFRPEDFGGIVYKRQNDKLIFLKSRLAIDLMAFAGQGTVQQIISYIGSDGSPNLEKRVLHILSSLKEMGIVNELAR